MIKEVLKEKIMVTKSSLVEFLVYDYENKKLDVQYKRGRHKGKLRTYIGISYEEYQEILQSESVGRQLLKTLSLRKQEEKSFLDSFKNIFSSRLSSPY